ERAARSQLVVTNHSLLAIDAIESVPMIPEYDVVVIDEAHELTTRVTQAATDELWAAEVERAAPSGTSTAHRPTTSPTPPMRSAQRSARPARAASSGSPTTSPTRWCWSA